MRTFWGPLFRNDTLKVTFYYVNLSAEASLRFLKDIFAAATVTDCD